MLNEQEKRFNVFVSFHFILFIRHNLFIYHMLCIVVFFFLPAYYNICNIAIISSLGRAPSTGKKNGDDDEKSTSSCIHQLIHTSTRLMKRKTIKIIYWQADTRSLLRLLHSLTCVIFRFTISLKQM